jgi:hypothetical protein
MNNKKKLKSIVYAMVLAAGMLLPAGGYAQENGKWGGGLFGRGATDDSDGWFRTFFNLEGEEEGDINNYGIGEEVPLGSGVVIMLAAGLGYWATNKKKEDEQ